jgi:hypothetical protein
MKRIFRTNDPVSRALLELEEKFNEEVYKNNLSDDEWGEAKCCLRDFAYAHYKIITAPVDREFENACHFGESFFTHS